MSTLTALKLVFKLFLCVKVPRVRMRGGDKNKGKRRSEIHLLWMKSLGVGTFLDLLLEH